MKTKVLCIVVLTLAFLGRLPCRAGILLSTNGYEYFNNTALAQLSLAPAFAADGGSGTVIAILPNGQVTNYYANPFPVNPPAGLSNVTAISMSQSGIILALTEQGAVSGWALSYSIPPSPPPLASQPPPGLSNVVAISAGDTGSLALRNDGSVVGWGTVSIPPGLSNVVAIDAQESFHFLEADGTVVVSPSYSLFGLSNVIAISSDNEGVLALRDNGTLVGCMGGEIFTNLLASSITDIVAISGGPTSFVALRQDGSVLNGGTSENSLFGFAQPLSNVFYLGREIIGTIVAVTGDGLPTFTIQPRGQTISLGQNIYLHARIVGQTSWQIQWQLNGTDLPGAINQDLIITNTTAADAGNYQAVVTFDFDYTAYLAESAVAQVRVLTPPPANAISFTAPHFASDGSLVISATSSDGSSFPFTNSSFLSLQTSSDLRTWTNLNTGWAVSNGSITISPSAQTPNSSVFYRLSSH